MTGGSPSSIRVSSPFSRSSLNRFFSSSWICHRFLIVKSVSTCRTKKIWKFYMLSKTFPYVFLGKHSRREEENRRKRKKIQHERYKWSHQSEKKTPFSVILQSHANKQQTEKKLQPSMTEEHQELAFRTFNQNKYGETTKAENCRRATNVSSSSRLLFDVVERIPSSST